MMRIGVLGVGDLTKKMVRGWCRIANGNGSGSSSGGPRDVTIVLSPRGRERAQALAREFGCTVMPSNQAVVDAADIVLVGVRAAQLPELAAEVRLRPAQPLISVMAGVPVRELERHFAGARCSRAMLSYAAQINRSSVAIHAADPDVVALLSWLGTPIELATEHDFELASVAACMNGWFYFLMSELEAWFVDKGLARNQARALTLASVEDCAAYSRYRAADTPREIGLSIATPGTFTEAGLQVLEQSGANRAWREAAERVFDQLGRT